MKLLALSCNFRCTELSVLERLSLSRERLEALYSGSALGVFSECAVISTCNRVEIYAAGNALSEGIAAKILSENSGVPAETILKQSEVFSDAAAVAHLFNVAAGLDSRMVGEAEIFGQVKQAYETAFAHGKTGVVKSCFSKKLSGGEMGAHAHGSLERTNQRRERRRGACRAHFRGNGALRRAGCRNGRRGTQNGAGFCFPRRRERFGGKPQF